MEEKIRINCVIGIDPGRNGGIAVYVPGRLVKTLRMPRKMEDIQDYLAYYRDAYKPIVFLEKLSVRPDDVMVQGGAAALGKLYRIQQMMASYEHLKAIIETLGVPYVLVHPGKWQSALQLRAGHPEEKAERKRRYKGKAATLYPEVRATLWNADALLIMHFGRWALVNAQQWVKANLPEREYPKLF